MKERALSFIIYSFFLLIVYQLSLLIYCLVSDESKANYQHLSSVTKIDEHNAYLPIQNSEGL